MVGPQSDAGRKRLVLLVEDNAANRYLMSFLLRSRGLEVMEAEDGDVGVRTALSSSPDIIVMDIQLPGVDGFEAMRRIRASARADNTPIVAVTSHAMVGDRERCLSAGFTSYIEKPIDPIGFLDTIESLLAEEVGDH